MRTIHTISTALAAALVIGGLAVPVLGGDVVRGRDLMTTEEWQAHRTEMLNATTPAQRQELRQRMQRTMEQRAAEQGVTLRHQTGAPMGGRAMGSGPCPGGGYGWGSGSGR